MRLGRLAAVLILTASCGGPSERLRDAEREAIRAELERLVKEAYDITKPNVADRMLSLYPDTGRVVSASAGGVTTTRAAVERGVRYFWDNVGQNMRDPRIVWDEMHVDVLSPNAAVLTARYRIPHRNPRNEPHLLGGAMTLAFERREGRWMVVQEHLSDVPQAADSGAINTPEHRH